MRKLIVNLFRKLADKIEKTVYLDQYDVLDLGFKRVSEDKRFIKYKKDNYSLTFEPKKYNVSIRWNNNPRHYGIVLTKNELEKIMGRLENVYKK